MADSTFYKGVSRMADYLLSGHRGSLRAEDCSSIQSIADALASSGIGIIKIRDLQAAAIQNALEASCNNRTHAAQKLGISVRTLQRKLASRSPGGSDGGDPR